MKHCVNFFLFSLLCIFIRKIHGFEIVQPNIFRRPKFSGNLNNVNNARTYSTKYETVEDFWIYLHEINNKVIMEENPCPEYISIQYTPNKILMWAS